MTILKRGHIMTLIAFFVSLVLLGTLDRGSWGAEKPKGELVIAVSGLGREIWTPLEGSLPEQYPAGMWYEKLVYRGLGNDENLYPGLAESWSISDDGLTYAFNIRKGVQFNENWGPFTAEDALFSFRLIGRDDSQNGFRHIIREWVEGMDVVNPYVFRVKLKKPHPEFLLHISDFYPYFMMVSKKYFETAGEPKAAKHPVGTGPFVFKRQIVGDRLEVEAVDKHWRRTSEFKKILFKIVPEQGARISMLKAGEADLISLSTGFLTEVEGAGFRTLSNPGSAYYTVLFGGQNLPERKGYDPSCPWTSQEDPERARKVRMALSLAINKQEIIDYILKKKAKQLAVHGFPPGSYYADPAWKPYPYDPKEAKRLLTEAGYPSGFSKPIKIYLYTLGGREELPDCGEAVAMAWEKIGLKVDRVRTTFEAFRDGWYSRGEIHRWGTTVLGITPFPEPIMYYNMASKSTTRVYHVIESTKTDQMIEDVMNERNSKLRVQKQQALGKYIYDNYLCCPIAMKDTLYGISRKVKDWTMQSLNSYIHNLEYIHRN